LLIEHPFLYYNIRLLMSFSINPLLIILFSRFLDAGPLSPLSLLIGINFSLEPAHVFSLVIHLVLRVINSMMFKPNRSSFLVMSFFMRMSFPFILWFLLTICLIPFLILSCLILLLKFLQFL